jgi:hypothetical protein
LSRPRLRVWLMPRVKRKAHGGARPGAGRKPGEATMAVKLPVRLVEAARVEKERRSESASIPAILTEWCDAGREG